VVVVAVAFSQARSSDQQRKQFFPGPLGWIAVLVLTLLAAALGWALGGRWVAVGAGGGMLLLTLGLKSFEHLTARRAIALHQDRGGRA
jgi:hypothetical protein